MNKLLTNDEFTRLSKETWQMHLAAAEMTHARRDPHKPRIIKIGPYWSLSWLGYDHLWRDYLCYSWHYALGEALRRKYPK